jgi:endoglucanase
MSARQIETAVKTKVRHLMTTALLALSIAACGSTCSRAKQTLAEEPPPPSNAAPTGTPPPPPQISPPGWLKTDKNQLLTADGKPFHGRGANLHDTRGCNACTFEEPNAGEVIRRVNVLVDDWHANFIRLDLESYDKAEARVHYKSLLEDEAYLKDLQKIVAHVGTKKGVYMMLSLWKDPSQSPMGWPTKDTIRVWEKLATAFKDAPQVMFGLINEPERNEAGLLDDKVWKSMNDTVDAIRKIEGTGPKHIIAVQGTRQYARVLDYYVTHPITAGGGVNIVYETHVYDPAAQFNARFVEPKKKIPVIIGEFGPVTDVATMSLDDCKKLMDVAEANDVPYLAYTFHFRCPPNLLVDKSDQGCGIGMTMEPTDWGKALKERLAKPW